MNTNNHRLPIPQTDLLIVLDNGEAVFAREWATGPAQTATSHAAQAGAAATREHCNPQLAYFRIIQPKAGDRVLQRLPPPGPRKGLVLAIGAYQTDHIQRIKHAIEAHLKNPDFTIYDLHPRNTHPPQVALDIDATVHPHPEPETAPQPAPVAASASHGEEVV